jgi:hypothetical protein
VVRHNLARKARLFNVQRPSALPAGLGNVRSKITHISSLYYGLCDPCLTALLHLEIVYIFQDAIVVSHHSTAMTLRSSPFGCRPSSVMYLENIFTTAWIETGDVSKTASINLVLEDKS